MFHTCVHGAKPIGFPTMKNLANTQEQSHAQITKQKSALRAEKTKHSKITLKADANQLKIGQ
jgi:hypothetical protein